jgi:hypothetical protein
MAADRVGIDILSQAAGEGQTLQLELKLHQDTARHGYPWVPTDQAHGRP